MNLTTKLHPAHLLTMGKSICIEVKYSSITRQDISGVMKFANLFASTSQNSWNSRGNVRLVFSGYCNDPRELWEIPEVRSYVKKLTEAWPEWMFFLDTTDQTLRVCFMCLVQMERTADPGVHRVVDLPTDVLVQGFSGINKLCKKYQFSDVVRDISSREVAACIGFSPIADGANSGCEHQVNGGAA
ncbi:hypothetical protein [Rhodoferax sp.]|uniref:hypothetical protein n=1 Tax=Rhodoferax sp. TaxID=50421 RepID=UPI00374C9AA3